MMQADEINNQFALQKLKPKTNLSRHIYKFVGSEELSGIVSERVEKQLREGCRFPQSVTAFPGCRVMFLAPRKVKAGEGED